MFFFCLVTATGCAPTVPASFQFTPGPVLTGRVLAIAQDRGVVVAATPAGLFRRVAQGDWERVDSPGIRDMSKVTALALLGEELFVATSGDGLFILSGGTWEVLSSRYGGLPDDRVLCLAADGKSDALFGADVWAGTAKGLAVRRGGKWEVFSPRKRWLWDLAGTATPREGKVYLTERFTLAQAPAGGSFNPPVRAIGIGQGRVVLGGESQLAVLDRDGFAIIRLDVDLSITALMVEESVLWAGTSRGLLWGGRLGIAERFPYPSWRPSVGSSGILFGGRDSRPYHYIWRPFGFNTARVDGLARDGQRALWVAYDEDGRRTGTGSALPTSEEALQPDTSLRRYDSIEEYIEAGEKPHYEVYGKDQGIRGTATSLAFSEGIGSVLVGTTEGVVFLK